MVERSLRDEGYEPYFPRLRKEIRHHRSKALLVRSFPLFTGYIFVSDPGERGDWRGLRECDGVGSLLGFDGQPLAVPASQVERLREAQAAMVFDDTREARILRQQEGRTHRETISMQFPAGALFEVTGGPFAGFHGHVESITGRGMVRGMIDMFGRLSPVEIGAEQLALAA